MGAKGRGGPHDRGAAGLTVWRHGLAAVRGGGALEAPTARGHAALVLVRGELSAVSMVLELVLALVLLLLLRVLLLRLSLMQLLPMLLLLLEDAEGRGNGPCRPVEHHLLGVLQLVREPPRLPRLGP